MPIQEKLILVRREESVFAIPISQVAEVGRLPRMNPVGWSECWLRGLTVLHGIPIAVVDLLSIFKDVPGALTLPRCFAATRSEPSVLIAIDELCGIAVPAANSFQDSQSGSHLSAAGTGSRESRFIGRFFVHQGSVVPVVNVSALVTIARPLLAMEAAAGTLPNQ